MSEENQSTPHFTLVRADLSNFREAAIALSTKLTGRDPTPAELEKLDARIAGMKKKDAVDESH